MYIQLPPLREDKILHFRHFPTVHQCVIFRNWGLVPPERIAKVLHTDVGTVKTAAAEMGLNPAMPVHPDWMTKGYITIIHYNWLHTAGMDTPAPCLHPAGRRFSGSETGAFQARRTGLHIPPADGKRKGSHGKNPPDGSGNERKTAAVYHGSL